MWSGQKDSVVFPRATSRLAIAGSGVATINTDEKQTPRCRSALQTLCLSHTFERCAQPVLVAISRPLIIVYTDNWVVVHRVSGIFLFSYKNSERQQNSQDLRKDFSVFRREKEEPSRHRWSSCKTIDYLVRNNNRVNVDLVFGLRAKAKVISHVALLDWQTFSIETVCNCRQSEIFGWQNIYPCYRQFKG